MPITIQHTPVGALAKLSVMAGQARERQIQMARDIQLASIAQAGARRPIPTDGGGRTYAIQRAGAGQIAKQRQVESPVLEQRKDLQKFVSDAKSAGIYDSNQIKQMQIFADLGDEASVRAIAGKLPRPVRPTARRQEIRDQIKAVDELGKGSVAQIQQQLDMVNTQLKKRFTPESWSFLRENPRFADEDTQELLIQQGQLQSQLDQTTEQAGKMKRMLKMGLTIPEQMAFEMKQEAQLTREEETERKRLAARVSAAGELSDKQKLAVDVIRDQERDRRTLINREITRLSKDLDPFTDESEDDHTERIVPVQSQIRQLELERAKSFAREKKSIEGFLLSGTKEITPIVTDSTGQRWQFTGEYRDGKPLYEEVE